MKNRSVRNLVALFLVLACLLMTAGCKGKGLNISSSEVKEFINRIDDARYADAISVYFEKIAGDSMLEQEADTVVIDYLNQIKNDVLSGKISEKDSNAKIKTVENVYSSTGCPSQGCDTIVEEIQLALQSKVAYQSGCKFLDSKNYSEAVKEFGKVLENDQNYNDAVNKKEQAAEGLRKSALEKEKQAITQGDYIKAIKALDEAISVLPEDSELLSEKSVCEANYVKDVIEKADATFTDYTKYEEALKIIKSGQQYAPENADLEQKAQYYTSFEPVDIFSLTSYNSGGGGLSVYTDMTDVQGNTYTKVFFSGYNDCFETYEINKKYNVLHGTVATRDKGVSRNIGLYIYGDGKLLWSNKNLTGGMKSFDIDVDITGVTDLKIMFSGDLWLRVMLADVTLQKTAK